MYRRRCLMNAMGLLTLTIIAGVLLSFNHNKEKALYRRNVKLQVQRLNIRSTNYTKLQHNGTSVVNISRETPNNYDFTNRFPRYMIIGFGKAGTKALYEALKLHPLLSGPYKEQRFFSLHYSKGLQSYLNSIPPPPRRGHTIEKSPDYMINPEAPRRILSALTTLDIDPTSLKFVVVIRNPIDRALSEYVEWGIQRKNSLKEKLPPFSTMVFTSDGEIDSTVPYINTSCYAYHVRNWLHYFPREQLCFVDGDRFVSNPYAEVHLLEECLGLSHHFTEENFVFIRKKGFYCFKENRTSEEPLCMGKSKGRKHPDVAQSALRKLNSFFRSWNTKLIEVSGRMYQF